VLISSVVDPNDRINMFLGIPDQSFFVVVYPQLPVEGVEKGLTDGMTE
jgi:hypothetical protein